MAINGYFYGKTSNTAIKPKITWEAVSDAQGNYSDVTATLSYSRKDSYSTGGYWSGTIAIDGDTKSRSGHYMVITKDSNTVAITHTVRVPHDDNGSRRITVSATGAIPNTTLTKTIISGEVALEDIPRAASIAASDGDIGSTVMVTIGRKSDKHRCTVAYRFGSLKGFLTESGLTDKVTETQSTCLAFPIPESFYAQIPDKATALCTLTCTTFLDDIQIGASQESSFTVRANPDRCGPLLAGSVTDSNPATLALTGDETLFIRGESRALCVMQTQPRWGATLVQKKIADTVITGDKLEIPAFGLETVGFWVTDSRGYTTHLPLPASVIPYFPPVVRLQAARKDPVSGDGQLTAWGNFYNGGFGTCSNQLQLRWRLNDGPWQTMEPKTEGNAFTCAADISGMDYTRSHRITLEVTDALHSITLEADIQPGIPVFDWGSEDFAFHVPVSMHGEKISNVKTPTEETDAANKAYVDSRTPGVIAPVNGFFTLSVDENGDLWAHSSGDGTVPEFEYDNSTGDLYFVTE